MNEDKILTKGKCKPNITIIIFLTLTFLLDIIMLLTLFEYLNLFLISCCFLLLPTLPLLIWGLFQNKYIEIVVTEKRVYVVNTKTDKFRNELPFDKISSLIKSGSDSFKISTSSGMITIVDCINRDEVFECISEQLKKSQIRHVIVDAVLADESNINNENNIEEIREYKKLLDEGIITQEEFETKKKQILKL